MRKVAFLSSLFLVFSIPWENAIAIAQFGTLTRVVGLVTVLACIGATLEMGFRRLHIFHALLLAFVCWNIASFFWSLEPTDTIQRAKTYAQLAIMSWIFWELYTDTEDMKAVLQAYILGCYVLIVSALVNYSLGNTISEYQYGRFAGARMNAVDQALILSFGLPVGWYLVTSVAVKGGYWVLRVLNYVYIPISLFAIMLTGSRTGIFVCIPAIVYIFLTSGKIAATPRTIIYLVLIGAAIFAVYNTPSVTLERLATARKSIMTVDLGGRVHLWKASLDEFSKHALLGIGSGSLSEERELTTVAHNTLISIAAELGLVGLALFILILSIIIYHIFYQTYPGKTLWATIFLIWLLGAATLTWEYRKPTWLVLNLIFISSHLADERIFARN